MITSLHISMPFVLNILKCSFGAFLLDLWFLSWKKNWIHTRVQKSSKLHFHSNCAKFTSWIFNCEQRHSFPAKSILNYKLIYYQVYFLLKKEAQTFFRRRNGSKLSLVCWFRTQMPLSFILICLVSTSTVMSVMTWRSMLAICS